MNGQGSVPALRHLREFCEKRLWATAQVTERVERMATGIEHHERGETLHPKLGREALVLFTLGSG